MEQYTKDWIKSVVVQFIIYIAMLALVSLTAACIASCSKEDGVDTKREFVAGSYYIEETSETITFSDNGIWYYDKSTMYPEDDIFGTFSVDSENTNIIYCFYYIESEDADRADTMYISRVSDTKCIATGVPAHNKESRFTLTKNIIY